MREVATKMLRQYGSAKAALPHFVKALLKQRDLLDALALDFLQDVAADTKPSREQPKVKVSTYNVPEHGRRTPSQVLAAKEAAALQATAIFDAIQIDGQSIGNIKWRELIPLARDKAGSGASHFRLGTHDTEIAVLLLSIEAYTQVSDEETTVREAVPPAVLARLVDEARVAAPRLIEESMAMHRRRIEEQRKLEAGGVA